MKKIICGIYKITNQLNGKFYIGKSVNIHKRWLTHCRDTDSCPIHKAIQKYGKENFSLTILEQCSQENLNDREIFWIQTYNGYQDSNCYNTTKGGDGSSHPVKLSHIQVLEIIDLLKNSSLSNKDIANKYNVSPKTISDINNGKSRIIEQEHYPIRQNKYDGKHPTIKEKYSLEYTSSGKQIQSYHSIQIGQYNEQGELLNIYPSIREASRIIGCNSESIRKALKSKTHKSFGFIWKNI